MTSILRLFRQLLGLAALLGALACAILASAAQGGRWSDKLDGLTHFAPLLLLGGMGALLLWLVAGRKGRMTPILAAITIISTATLMAPEMIATAQLERVEPRSETLKIVQFNAFRDNYDVPGSLAWIRAQDADLVVLEEVLSGEGRLIARDLADPYPYQIGCPNWRCGTVIRSKKPPLDDPMAIPIETHAGAVAWARFQGEKSPYSVIGVHYAWPAPISHQWGQRRAMKETVKRFSKDSLIVVGDFNSTPWSFALRRQDHDFGLERRTRALFSWPTKKRGVRLPPFLPIDHLYAGKDWRTVSVSRGPALGSDHYPIVVELTR